MKKNKVLIALLLVLLFIPTYIAIANYVSVSKSPVTVDSATNIIIKDPVGKSYSIGADSEATALFQKINSNATPIDGLPDKLMDADNFVVTFVEGKRATDSRYYFSLDINSAYYLDSEGKAFSVLPEHAAEFLETNYAQSLYAEAYLPTLTNGATKIAPESYEWAYQSAAKTPLASTLADTAKGQQTLSTQNGLAFEFSRQPDVFNITVKDTSGNILDEGDYTDVHTALDIKDYSSLAIEISAEWGGTEEHMSGGHAKYSFILNIEAQPEFDIAFSGKGSSNYDAFIPGDIAFVTGFGVTDVDKVTFKSTPELTHDGEVITPKFFSDGTNAYAFIPTAYDTAPGEYTLELGYNGIVVSTLTMTVAEHSFGIARDIEVSVARTGASRTEETLAAYDAMVEQVLSDSDFSECHFDNTAFADPDGDKISVRGYGKTRTISTTRDKYVNKGIDYTMGATENILATMHGEVIYVGSTAYAGTAIAIDHGYGLISWYHHVSGVKVSKGDKVAKGDVIADKVADEGFTDGSTLHFRLTVYDVPVSAYDLLWSDTDGDNNGDLGINFVK